jgi:hypothetical protein
MRDESKKDKMPSFEIDKMEGGSQETDTQEEHQKKVDYVELICYVIVILAEITLLLVMLEMNFKQFSIV